MCRGISIFLILDPKHRLCVHVRTASPSTQNQYFEQKYQKYHFFQLKIFNFKAQKIYLCILHGQEVHVHQCTRKSVICIECWVVDTKFRFTHIYRMDCPIIIIWVSPLLFLGASGVIFKFYSGIFHENSLSKQNSPRWDAAFCGVTSWAIRFAYVP